MKSEPIDRRIFLSGTARAGIGLCGLCMCSPLASFAGEDEGAIEKIDISERCFCVYNCPDECKLLQGTLQDDFELKK